MICCAPVWPLSHYATRSGLLASTHVRNSDHTVFFSGESGGFVAHGYLDLACQPWLVSVKVGSSVVGWVASGFSRSRGRGTTLSLQGTRALEVEISRTPTIFE